MAADTLTNPIRPPVLTIAELIAFTKKELDADAERQAKLHAAAVGELPSESQPGATLDLSHKNIHALPAELISFIKDKVERLALSHNPQVVLPSEIVQCDRLRYLNVRWNQLKVFPDVILDLNKLEILDLSKNRISVIPEGIRRMTSLKFLAVARNRITHLPIALGEMASLTKLKFDENPIVFPPLESLRPSSEQSHSILETELEKDVCIQVKKFMRNAGAKQRTMAQSEDDFGENNVETPRPPRRTITGGRFPIRPSISGMPDQKTPSPDDRGAPPIPQRSHARETSNINPTPPVQRPSASPLVAGGREPIRTRSETATSSSSLRSRRQGFVPTRKPTGELGAVSEVESHRSSQASTIKPIHSGRPSSSSKITEFLSQNGGETSSGATSPVDGTPGRFPHSRKASNLNGSHKSRSHNDGLVKSSRRLIAVLEGLNGPLRDVFVSIKDGTPQRTAPERHLSEASIQTNELDRVVARIEKFYGGDIHKDPTAPSSFVICATMTMTAYSTIIKDLKQNVHKAVNFADGMCIRTIMFQLYYAMIELRNICTLLGFVARDAPSGATPRITQTWSSSQTVTPTQPTRVNNTRLKGATIIQNAPLRAMLPPGPPVGNISRTNTMSSISSTRSGDAFTTFTPNIAAMTQSTLRDVEESDGDQQFDKIFLSLRRGCEVTSEALPLCRAEFVVRKQKAQKGGQSRLAQAWELTLNLCEAMTANNDSLLTRLQTIRVNDPGVNHQSDFWQLCDKFVHSWTALASQIRIIGSQKMDDITPIKSSLRDVQRAVKEVSNTISRSSLYQQAIGSRRPEAGPPQTFMSSYTPNMNQNYAHGAYPGFMQGTINTHAAPDPTTPLSAALGPAAQATIASPNGSQLPRDLFPPPPPLAASRVAHERVDTVMQPPGSHSRR